MYTSPELSIYMSASAETAFFKYIGAGQDALCIILHLCQTVKRRIPAIRYGIAFLSGRTSKWSFVLIA